MNIEETHIERLHALHEAQRAIRKVENIYWCQFLDHAEEQIKLAILQENKDYEKKLEISKESEG